MEMEKEMEMEREEKKQERKRREKRKERKRGRRKGNKMSRDKASQDLMIHEVYPSIEYKCPRLLRRLAK